MTRRLLFALGGVFIMALSSCGGGQRPGDSQANQTVGPSAPNYKVGDPYRVDGKWYHPAVNRAYDETGVASWYGAKFHGNRTANGEIYNMNLFTAAHKTLPMPTKARVTNLENGRSIIVRVNDRGPFVNGRIIDVSRASAEALGFALKGTARVRVQVIDEQPPNQTFVAAKAETSAAEQSVSGSAPVTKVSVTALPGSIGLQMSNIIDDNWADAVITLPVMQTNLYVQAGAFIHPDNAERLRQAISWMGPVEVSSVYVDGQEFFRVRLGPLRDVSQADTALNNLLTSGHHQAAIVVE